MDGTLLAGKYTSLDKKREPTEAHPSRICRYTCQQHSIVKKSNAHTGSTEKLRCKLNELENEKNESEKSVKEKDENNAVASDDETNAGYVTKSRGILKKVPDNEINRPTTVGSSRDTDCIILPRWQSMENQKYSLKVNALIGSNDVKTKRKSEEIHLPEVSIDTFEDKMRKHTTTKNALKERINEVGDTYTYFNQMKLEKTSETDSAFFTDGGHFNLPSSPSRNTYSHCVGDIDDDEAHRYPWEDTPEPKPVSISDSEECDTDLEMDKDFGKDIMPASDLNIGRTVYIRECQKWKVSPQKHVLKSLHERSLSLRNRSLGAMAILPLCAALRDNLRVERLNLDGVDITDEGIQHLAEMLLDNITIAYLNIANNSLGIRGAQVLGHVLVVTQNITYLNLSGNKLDENSSWYLTTGIGSNSSITHLDLSYNDLGEQAGVLMGAALARNSKLRNLNMCWNKVCGKGAVAIFRTLMVNSTLEVLNISWNGMGYDGAVALSKCLKRNEVLRDLDVSNNRLNWRCAFLLAEGLRANHTLAKLKIGYNPLTTTGVMDCLEAVATDDSAVTLLDCTEIPVLGAADLLSATISRRRSFQFLHGGIVPTHDKLGQRLGRELNPMLRIIEYLRLLGLRPLELMKSFDKTSSFELPRKEFIDQIKKIGVKVHAYEIEALANSISGKGYNKNVINYRKLSLAVREVVEAERERKIKEREEWLQIKSYHESILKKGTLEDYMSHSGSARDPLDPLRVKSFQTIGLSGTSKNSSTTNLGSVGSSNVSLYSPLVLSKSTIRHVKQPKTKKRKRRKDIPCD